MATKISEIETIARRHLIETDAFFWTSPELTDIIIRGVRDLWRDIVDLKQEHYLTINATDVYLDANSFTLSGVPTDIHKVYLLEARDLSENGNNHNLFFKPRDYNDTYFQSQRGRDPIEASSDMIYYAVHGAGSPVAAPTILVAPRVSSRINLTLCYVPTLGQMTTDSTVPIPGEADNALVAWTVAFARAKEREDRAPDSGWLAIYATEKQHLLQSLGLRQYQEPTYVQAEYEEYWG